MPSRELTATLHPPACKICGHPVVSPKNHDVPAMRAVRMFPPRRCRCGKPARVRCFNGLGTVWIECEDGHAMGVTA
ncbi:MAG: hypothetical protein ACRENE_23590 [Polyangiaceae bacterium]